jgi:hypothetical protein
MCPNTSPTVDGEPQEPPRGRHRTGGQRHSRFKGPIELNLDNLHPAVAASSSVSKTRLMLLTNREGGLVDFIGAESSPSLRRAIANPENPPLKATGLSCRLNCCRTSGKPALQK